MDKSILGEDRLKNLLSLGGIQYVLCFIVAALGLRNLLMELAVR